MIEIQHADSVAAGGRSPDSHLGDVHSQPAECGADPANDAGHVLMREHQQNAVEIGLQPMTFQLHQPRHRMPKQRAGRAVNTIPGHEVNRHHGAECPGIGAALLHQLDPPLAQQDLRIDDVDVVKGGFEQAGSKRRRHQLGVAGSDFATVGDRTGTGRGVVEL